MCFAKPEFLLNLKQIKSLLFYFLKRNQVMLRNGLIQSQIWSANSPVSSPVIQILPKYVQRQENQDLNEQSTPSSESSIY